jgi:hypothetical protein
VSTFRTDKFGRTVIAPNNKIGKDGFTADEIGGRPPKPPPKEPQGDPEEAKKFMRAFGMHGLADMYETNGNAAKNGELPPFFQNHPYSGVIKDAQNTKAGNVKILKEDEPVDQKNTATVGEQARVKIPPKPTVAQLTSTSGSLPLPNELERFASYNNIFSFGCISPEELNFPDETYRKTGVRSGQMVLRSNGGLTAPQKPRTHAESHYNIDTAYFIDNVDIETVIAPNKKSRMTNFHSLSFEIREPYSMGQLLQTMQLAAMNAGYQNYLEAPWLLTINFLGWQDAEQSSPALQSSKKLLPCKIVSVDFNVDTEGSIYRFSCSAFNDEAFTDGAQNLPCNVTLYGKDLEEICQSGLGSLATAINTHILKQQKFEKDKVEQDEYIFSFPQETSSFQQSILFKGQAAAMTGTATTGDTYKEKEGIDYEAALASLNTNEQAYNKYYEQASMGYSMQTTADIQKDYVNSLLGYSIKRGKLSETIKKTIANRDAGINAIGKNLIKPEEPLSSGDSPFGNAEFVLNRKTQTMERGATTIDPKRRTIQFRAGTPIQRVLEELVLLSEFGQSVLKKQLQDKTGNVPWFRIEADLYIVEDPEAEKKRGRMPRIYVYKITPYDVNTQFFKMPNDPPAGYNQLVQEAAKAYNYMYTGYNKDILEFDIRFENAFYKSIAGDLGNNAGSNEPANQSTTKKTTEVELQGIDGPAGANVTNVQKDNTSNASNELAGGLTETAELKIARQFNESLANSDVDLITMTIKILGDPYYIADSGMGNYNAQTTSFTNINADGTINHQSGQVHILLNFLTPIDIDEPSGRYKMDGPQVGVSNFSGLYQVIGVNNNFSGNLFTQELELVKMNNFELKDLDEQNQSKIADIKNLRTEKINKAAEEFGPGSPQHEFALADLNGDGKLSNTEIVTAGYSFDEATKLATDASKPKPAQPKVAKNAQVDADILPSNPGDRSMGAFSQGGGT